MNLRPEQLATHLQRELAPLVQAADAYLLDTSGLSIDDVVAKITGLCQVYRDAGKKV